MNSKEPSLVVLAAGLASRYGSLKQMEKFGPHGETIIDYAVYDALKAGFKKVIFIIRKDFYEEFREIFEPRLSSRIEIAYVFQDMHTELGTHRLPPERVKPFGTGQALLCCQGVVNGPFAVINADDFYGTEAYQKGYDFLTRRVSPTLYGAIGYKLQNTLSDNGYVSRGQIFREGNLIKGITERVKIYREKGQIVYEDEGKTFPLAPDTPVSMNFFCFDAGFIQLCIDRYQDFLDKHIQDIKAEFFMPSVADYFIRSGRGNIEMLPVDSRWFGVTYKADAPIVRASLDTLIAEGKYPEFLWKERLR